MSIPGRGRCFQTVETHLVSSLSGKAGTLARLPEKLTVGSQQTNTWNARNHSSTSQLRLRGVTLKKDEALCYDLLLPLSI